MFENQFIRTSLHSWNNGTVEIRVKCPPDNSWTKGVLKKPNFRPNRPPISESQKSKISKANKGRKYWNNSIITIFTKINPGKGWVSGRLIKRKPNKC